MLKIECKNPECGSFLNPDIIIPKFRASGIEVDAKGNIISVPTEVDNSNEFFCVHCNHKAEAVEVVIPSYLSGPRFIRFDCIECSEWDQGECRRCDGTGNVYEEVEEEYVN